MVDRAVWDAKVLALSGHLYQSWQWGEFCRSQGWQVERLLAHTLAGEAMAQVLFKHRGPVSYAYIPRGPVLSHGCSIAFEQLLAAIDDACRRHHAISLHIEPAQSLPSFATYTLVEAPRRFLTRRTLHVPLLDDDALLQQMRRNTAYAIRLAARRCVTVEQQVICASSLSLLYEALQETAERQGFGIPPRSYYDDLARAFGDDAILHLSRGPNGIAAMELTVVFGSVATDMASGSFAEHRSDGATAALTFEVMRRARARGCQWYDHDGLGEDDDPCQHGLNWFKLGFGGTVVEYPAPLEHLYHPRLTELWHRRHLGRETNERTPPCPSG